MMVAMDADALIKLTKASLKEDIVGAMDVVIPPAVRRECVEEGKEGGHADAVVIERNLGEGRIRVQEPKAPEPLEHTLRELDVRGGEADVLRLHAGAGADLIASDDARFLRLVEGLGLPFATPAALVVALSEVGALGRDTALSKLDDLAPHVSEAEHVAAREALLEGSP